MSNRRYLLFITLILSSIAYSASAQDITDALRYSYLSPTGTARSMGFGNALGSVGGDFTSLSVNPAGIGIYRTSEIMFTPSLKINSVDGSYLDNTVSSSNVRFNFNNLGVVFSQALRGKRYDNSPWKAVSFAIGVNRLADFNRDYGYSGTNSGPNSSSYSEKFAIYANSTFGNVNTLNTIEGVAYNAYLISPDSNGYYYTEVPWKAGITQEKNVTERGGINEIAISFGGNYMEKLMLGATLGIPVLRYTRDADITETALQPTSTFSSYTFSEHLTTKGAGINLKLGVIYKPSDYFRLGLAIHTPTYYSMHDEDNLTINNVGYQSVPSLTTTYDYHLVTPMRAILSATGFLGTHGFITADYEFVNYPSAQFIYQRADVDAQKSVNSDIHAAYTNGSNFRIGAEGRITKYFMVRAGFGYYSSPYKDYSSDTRTDISAGVGFHFDDWYLDVAYQHTQYKNPELFYRLDYSNVPAPIIQEATLKNGLNNAVMTVGFKF